MPDDFLATYTPLANEIGDRTGLNPAVVLGIIDTETGGGRRVLGNNIFGITPPGGVARYPDVQTAANAFISLMQAPRYRGVATAGDPASQAAALVKGGYNTVNPAYATIVANKALNFGKQLGYQDGSGSPPSGPSINVTSSQPVSYSDQPAPAPAASPPTAPSYSDSPAPAPVAPPTPAAAPAAPAQPPASATDQLIQELKQPPASGQPAASGKPQSATDDLIRELKQPTAPGALTGPPDKKAALPSSAGEPDAPAVTPEGGSFELPAKGATPYTAAPLMPGGPTGRGLGDPGTMSNALLEGYRSGPRIIDQPAIDQAERSGPLGYYVTSPLMQVANAPLQGLSALYKGGQAAIENILSPLNPLLGTNFARDFAAMPEAFPTGPEGMPPEQARYAGGTSGAPPPPRPQYVSERTAPPRPPGMTDLERMKQLIAHDEAERAGVRPQPPSLEGPEPPAEPSGGVGGGPTPEPSGGSGGAAGAQVTTEPIPEKTDAQRATDIRKDVAQSAADRAGPGWRDDEPYFNDPKNPIPPRPEAYRDFSTQTAVDHKYYYDKDPSYRSAIDDIDRQRNAGMTDSIKEDMGDRNTLSDLIDKRRDVTPDQMGVFKDEKPVDPGLLEGFRKKLADLIDGPFSKRKGIRGILEDIQSTLYDKNGNIETMPSKLQGVRDNMTDWLNKKGGSDTASKDVQAAEHAITGLVEDLNPVMTSGAPKWDQWRAEWAARSKLIDQQKFLQNYDHGRSKSLWDPQGNLQFRKIDQMLDDIANAHADKAVHPAKSLTDDQIQKIVTVRNELAAKDLTRVRAAVPHASTHQMLQQAAQKGGTTLSAIARGAADTAIHGAGVYLASKGVPFVNMAYGIHQGTRPFREQRKATRAAATMEEQENALKQNLLKPGPTNPLQP